MKKISQISWKRFKDSAEGKAIIAQFKNLNENTTPETVIALASQYSPQFFLNNGVYETDLMHKIYDILSLDLATLKKNGVKIKTQEDFDDFYSSCISFYSGADSQDELKSLSESAYKPILSDNMLLTTALYCQYPQFCIPNFFPLQYPILKKIVEKYQLEIPAAPQKSKYRMRCMHYLEINAALLDFAHENGIESTAEICAFLYGYEMPLIRESMEQEGRSLELPSASQIWMIEGNYGEGERDMEYGFWQANTETRRGDILVFYEKTPTKAINSIWRAEEDGCADPFFMYYSHTFIGRKISVPAITFDELKKHPYFSQHALVRKNFQGGSGWHLTAEDYRVLQGIWTEKGYDCASLPQLKAHEAPANIDYTEREAAVHKYQVIPLLADMGWTEEDGSLINQVVQHVGRGQSRTNGRTDISLHPYGEDMKKARVLIEEKFWMKNEKEKKDAFEQGLSYALLSESKTLVICDKSQIIVYPKKKDTFRFDHSITFYWDEMSNPDKFNELRKLIA